MPPAARKRDYFKHYDYKRDETRDGAGQLRADYAPCIAAINALAPGELKLRQSRIDRAAVELGLHFGGLSGKRRPENTWQLDLFPRILSASQWEVLSAGILQRARAFNAYIRDLYGEQNILRNRILPYNVVLGDPAFHRPFTGIDATDPYPCLFGAVDLIMNPSGDWLVLENHLATPYGLAFVLQNRRMLAQAFPELFKVVEVCPVASFTTQLLETLRNAGPGADSRIVLLSRDDSSQAFFEESFLARHMGIALTRPGDLLVRESQVFLKTIRGLEKVDVIYRRLESSSIDPVALPQIEFAGVPGLVHCARRGSVKIVNALGSGVADNRAILRYSDRLINYYLNQKPILRTVNTYHMSDRDQASVVEEFSQEMILKPIQDHSALGQLLGGRLPYGNTGQMLRLAKRHPEYFVAQPYLQPSRLPRFDDGRFQGRSVFLRVFFMLGANPVVLPGGLTRQGLETQQPKRNKVISEGMKDTWIPLAAHPSPVDHQEREVRIQRRDFSISSRVAEALYWIGRYLDRAESTARQLHILEDIRWDQLPQAARQSFWPLWRAVAAATGQADIAARKTPPPSTLATARQLLLAGDEPASILSSIRSAQFNAASIRDFINPETWQVLAELLLFLEEESSLKRMTPARLHALTEHVVAEVARIWGTAERTMLHDDGWQFFRAGTFMERAISNMTLTAFTLERNLKTFHRREEEDPDLAALLQLLGSLDAYRRAYSSRAHLDRVAHILIQSPNNPSSVAYCLANLRYVLGTLTVDRENRAANSLLIELERMAETLRALPIESIFPDSIEIQDSGQERYQADLRGCLQRATTAFDQIQEQLAALHEWIEDAYFSHQDAKPEYFTRVSSGNLPDE